MQVLRRTRRLKKSGDITTDMSKHEVATIIALDTADDEQFAEAWEHVEYGEVDWDSLLAFIEKLLAILLPLFT